MARKKGLPTIRQRKDRAGNKINCWEAIINLGRDPDTGKLKRIPVYGASYEECRQKLIETLASIQNQTFVEPHKITLSDWLDTWLKEYKKNSIRPTTFSSYEWIIKKHIKPELFSKAYIRDIQPHTIQKFYNKKIKSGLSARTVRYIHIILHAAFEQAIKCGYLVRNVTEATTLPKQQKKEIQVLTVEEQKKLMDALLKERIGTAFIMAMFTGLRMGEILALQWKHIDLDNEVVKVRQSLSRVYHSNKTGKNKSELIISEPKSEKGKRDIPLLNIVVSRLKEYRKQEMERLKFLEWNDIEIGQHFKTGFVFCDELGKPIKPRSFIKRFHDLLKRAGLPRTNVHSLRHLFATRGLELGIDLKTMQELLGHANISITGDIYSHVSNKVKREAVNKLNNLFAGQI